MGAREGDRIADRYELLTLLGEGGMGVVWHARDARLGRGVAVKLLSAASVGSDTARARLIREARAAASLEHEGVIRVYDVGEVDDGGAYLVMELVRGRSLRQAMATGDLRLPHRAALIVQAARALGYAHAAGIVHRDVKPDNIMIREDGRATVVDFGVAKPLPAALVTNAETIAGITSQSLTGAGHIVGTPAYLAPEQARGAEVTAATDQFALAVTAFEVLTGKIPWSGGGVVEIIASVLRDEPAKLSALDPALPSAFDDVIAKALAKTPRDRWPDIDAFADAFEKAASALIDEAAGAPAGGRSPSARPSGASSPSSAAARAPSSSGPDKGETDAALLSTEGGHATTAPSGADRLKAAGRSGALAIGALVVALMGVGAWAISRGTFSRGAAGGGATSSLPGAATVTGAAQGGEIACPSFEVSGIDEPWLGAAAATFACERLQIAHGGFDARTMFPAELARAPRDVLSGYPPALLEGKEARDKGLLAAKARATRWLDGAFEKQFSGFTVRVTLRSPDGGELSKGEGRGVELFEAVRDAMRPILATSPPTSDELKTLREWLDVSSVDEALALLDLRTAVLIEDPTSLKEACAAVGRRTDVAPRVAYLAKATCVKKLRMGSLDAPPPALDESTPGALITTTLAQGVAGGPSAVRERAARLERARSGVTSAEGQARLAAAAAELYNLVSDPHARQLARLAIQASPKATDWRASSWHRLAFASDGDASLASALATWQPWEPVSQSLRADRQGLTDPSTVLKYVGRAYLLSQRGWYARNYGELLLSQGNAEAARGVAELTDDHLLRVEILLGEAQYRAVLTTVPRLLVELPPTDEGAATAFQMSHVGVRAARILDRPADFVDGVVSRYVTSEPHHVVDGVLPFMSLVSSCCFAPRPAGKRCIERLEQLRAEGALPTIFSTSDVVIAGAARFVADDYAGAAKAWRTMLRSAGWIQDPLREAMAVAFERSNAPDLAEEVDAANLALVDLPRTADLSWVRGAKRARDRGDTARARKLATTVIDKWRFADEDVPAVREMKALLAKLPP